MKNKIFILSILAILLVGISLVSADNSCTGDANHDGSVDAADTGYIEARYGSCMDDGFNGCQGDVNGDGSVDLTDTALVEENFGECSLEVFNDITTDDVIELPQFESTLPLDIEGRTRTYLYCTWQIGDEGEQALPMSSQTCPIDAKTYRVQDNDQSPLSYRVRIDSAELSFDGTEWRVITTGIANQFDVTYTLDEIPEPPQSLFNNIIDTITGTVKGWLCSNFGVFC